MVKLELKGFTFASHRQIDDFLNTTFFIYRCFNTKCRKIVFVKAMEMLGKDFISFCLYTIFRHVSFLQKKNLVRIFAAIKSLLKRTFEIFNIYKY